MTEFAIETPRLILRPATAEQIEAEMHDRPKFASLLGVVVPENWPPEILVDALPWFLDMLRTEPELGNGWLTWYVILKDDAGQGPVLVGAAGFKGPALLGNFVETGYSMLPQYHRQGYASEAVSALIGWAFSHPEVSSVIAHTDSQPNPSIRLLEKLGFHCAGEGEEFGTLRFELAKPT